MKKVTRILSVLLALVMVLGMIPSALAAPAADELNDALNVSGGQLEFKNDKNHPWEVVTKNGRTYVSSTMHTPSTSTEFSAKLKIEKGQKIRFDYAISAQVYGDLVYLSVDGSSIWSFCAQKGDDLQNPQWRTYTYTPTESGTHTFSWGFHKDGSDYGDEGLDIGCFDNIEILDGETYEVIYRVEGGTFQDGTTEQRGTYAPGAKLTEGDVPVLPDIAGKEFLGWQLDDTNEYITPVGRFVNQDATFTARYITPNASTPNATIILESRNVYDGLTGNVMLFDPSCQAYGPIFTPGIMYEPKDDYGDVYDWNKTFPYVFPYGNDGTMESTSIVIDGETAGLLPAGKYDWAIGMPRITEYNWLVVDDLAYNTPGDDTYFAGGYTYRFVVEKYGNQGYDCMKLYITPGNAPADVDQDVTVTFQAGAHGSLEGSTSYTARNTTYIPASAVPVTKAADGYRFAGWFRQDASGEVEENPVKKTLHGSTTYVAKFEPIGDAYATIILESHNAYQDIVNTLKLGSCTLPGFVILLDSDRNTYGSVVSDEGYGGALNLNGKDIFDYYEYAGPAGFDGSPASDQVVRDGQIEIRIPAGTYDYAVCAVWDQSFVDAMNAKYGSGRYDSYLGCVAATEFTASFRKGGFGVGQSFTFEANKTYHFVASDIDLMDIVSLEITDTPVGCNHSDAQHLERIEPTCTENGRAECWYCAECNLYFSDAACTAETSLDQLTIPALDHDFDEGVITTEPSCTTPGVRTYTCQRPNCGEMKTEEIPALGHHASDAWASNESGHWHICTVCGQEIPDTRSAHTPDRDQATEEHGITCTVCGYVMAPPLGHTHVYTDTVVAPTCTESGYTLHTCACGHSYRDSETAPLGHDFGAWTVKAPASCTENGQSIRTCARCGAVETRIDAATGHVDADNDGKCDICGADLSAKPANPDQPANPGVKTGDESRLVLWSAAMAVCGLAACLLLRRKKLS